MLSPEEYTHTTPGKGFFQLGLFVATVFALAGVVSLVYEDKPSAPREFPGGLEEELGGPDAVRVRVGIIAERYEPPRADPLEQARKAGDPL